MQKNPTIVLKWWGLLFNTQSINNEAEFAFKFWILNFKIGPIFFFLLCFGLKRNEKKKQFEKFIKAKMNLRFNFVAEYKKKNLNWLKMNGKE